MHIYTVCVRALYCGRVTYVQNIWYIYCLFYANLTCAESSDGRTPSGADDVDTLGTTANTWVGAIVAIVAGWLLLIRKTWFAHEEVCSAWSAAYSALWTDGFFLVTTDTHTNSPNLLIYFVGHVAQWLGVGLPLTSIWQHLKLWWLSGG